MCWSWPKNATHRHGCPQESKDNWCPLIGHSAEAPTEHCALLSRKLAGLRAAFVDTPTWLSLLLVPLTQQHHLRCLTTGPDLLLKSAEFFRNPQGKSLEKKKQKKKGGEEATHLNSLHTLHMHFHAHIPSHALTYTDSFMHSLGQSLTLSLVHSIAHLLARTHTSAQTHRNTDTHKLKHTHTHLS